MNKKQQKPAYQQTKDKLKDLPFQTIKEKIAVEQEISLDNWKRLTKYKDFSSKLDSGDFEEIKEEFSTGFLCGYQQQEDLENIDGSADLVQVYKAKRGIQIKINEHRVSNPKFLSELASDMAQAFGSMFYEMGGLKKEDKKTNDTFKSKES